MCGRADFTVQELREGATYDSLPAIPPPHGALGRRVGPTGGPKGEGWSGGHGLDTRAPPTWVERNACPNLISFFSFEEGHEDET